MPQLRHAIRSLIKTPGFIVTALAILSICLAANVSIFAVVDAILIRPLPYPESGRLVTLYYVYPRLSSATPGASLTNYYERRGKLPALSSIAEISETTSVVGESGSTAIELLGRVTPEFFATLGVRPLLGRAFTDAELTYQTDHVAMISHEFWRSRFAADPNVLGRTIRLDGIPRRIVGVLPPDFRFLSFDAPVYMPLSSEEGERSINARHSTTNIMIGRLAPGARLAEARAQVDALDAALAPQFPDAKIVAEAGCHTIVAQLHADYVAPARSPLLLLQGGALLLLVIGGVNLLNLFLIRASGRAREFAIRQALGADRSEVAREVMTEILLFVAAGGLLGLVGGAAGVKLLASFGAARLPLGTQIAFDGRLVAFGVLSALTLGVVLGAPVVGFCLRSRLALALQSESRSTTVSRATQRLRQGFIVAQIALAFVLLAGAGLLGLSLQRAMAVAPGFRSDHVISARFNLTWYGYHTEDSFRNFFDQLHEKTRALPGVVSVGAISDVPMGGAASNAVITVPGHTLRPGEAIVVHDAFGVAGDYFAAMGIPLREGRYLDDADANRPEQPCVIDENFARHYWPNRSALGQQVYRGTAVGNDGSRPFTVVGVVGAVKQAGLTDRQPRGAIYYPYRQIFIRDYFLIARTSLPPDALARTLAKVVREIDPDLPLTDLRSMQTRVDDSLAAQRSPALLAGVFAAAALLLAAVGLYGVMGYSVAQRTSEFGIRMALGAQRLDVLRLVLAQGVRLVLIGLATGAGAALLLTKSMSSLLFDVQPNDPLALAGVAALLAAAALLACWLPAHRATKVDPLVALRAE